MRVITCQDTKEQSTGQEALNLNPFPSQLLDEGHGDEVSRNVPGDGDDQVSNCVLHQGVVFIAPMAETDLGQDDGLIQVGAVKGDIQEEPGQCRSQQNFEVAPLAEVHEEGIPLGSSGLGQTNGRKVGSRVRGGRRRRSRLVRLGTFLLVQRGPGG